MLGGGGCCQSNRLVTDVLSREDKGWPDLTLKCRPARQRSKTERKEVMIKACSSQGREAGGDGGGISPTWLKLRWTERLEEAGAGGDSGLVVGRLSEGLMLKAKALAPSPSPGPDFVSIENQLSLLSLDFFTCEMGLGAVS